jgi:hypothetical protein
MVRPLAQIPTTLKFPDITSKSCMSNTHRGGGGGEWHKICRYVYELQTEFHIIGSNGSSVNTIQHRAKY